jgi:hypothetical protein
MGLAILGGSQPITVAAAGDAVSKRQMLLLVVTCMRKRMSSDKVISYSDAAKVCRNQVNEQSNTPVSVAKVASDSAAKQ